MNDWQFSAGTPCVVRGDTLRVHLASGGLYDLRFEFIKQIQPAVSCCGSHPTAVITTNLGDEYFTDNLYSQVKALWDAWTARPTGELF